MSLTSWRSLCGQSILRQGGLHGSYRTGGGHGAQKGLQDIPVGTHCWWTLWVWRLPEGRSKPCCPYWWIQAKVVALVALSRQGVDLAMSSHRENLSDVPGRIWLLGKLHLKKHKQNQTWRKPSGLRPPNFSPSSLEISRFSFEITGREFDTRGERGRITAFTFMHNLPFYFPLLSGGYLVNQAPLMGLRILILFVGSC